MSAMRETQQSIAEWANGEFGAAPSFPRIAARANEEMAELLRATTIDLPDADEITEEAADVVIVLYRLAAMCGRDLHEVIDSKMAVNRGRKWKSDGTGHGYHVRTQASEQRDSI